MAVERLLAPDAAGSRPLVVGAEIVRFDKHRSGGPGVGYQVRTRSTMSRHGPPDQQHPVKIIVKLML